MGQPSRRIGPVLAGPGQKATGFVPIEGTAFSMPLTLVNGRAPGPTLLITAGVHGGEYPSIEAAIRLAAELDPGEVSGTVAVVPIVSTESFQARQQYTLPSDGKNVNRQFPGRALGTVSERIAYTVASVVAAPSREDGEAGGAPGRVDGWIDLHGGDIHEALVPVAGYLEEGAPEVRQQAKAMAEMFGIEHLIHPRDLPGTTFKLAASRGIPCIIAEAGQCGQMDEDSVQLLVKGCRNVAQLLGVLPGVPPAPGPRTEFRDYPWLRSSHTGCWYPSVPVGSAVRKGDVVGHVRDYFGTPIGSYLAPDDGVILLICTSLAINEGDPLYGLGILGG